MHTIIHRLNHKRFPSAEPKSAFRSPHYDCTDLPQGMKLVVYVPGVNASDVEVTTLGSDIFVTARKAHVVRTNWQSLHLEGVQRDYQLKLRLGSGFDYASLHASLNRGALTIMLPKKAAATPAPERHRQVA